MVAHGMLRRARRPRGKASHNQDSGKGWKVDLCHDYLLQYFLRASHGDDHSFEERVPPGIYDEARRVVAQTLS